MDCREASHLMSLVTCLTLLVLVIHGRSCLSDVQGGYWFRDSGIPASDIDSTLFTHLFCAFADLDNVTNRAVISPANAQPFAAFTADVQRKNPSVVTLLSIGGGSSSSDDFARMVSRPSSRCSFIRSSITLARSNGFYGLDLDWDWEYPNNTKRMTNLGRLFVEWRAAISLEAQTSGNEPLLLTAAVYYTSSYNGLQYPISAMSSSLDWINMMDYDFYGPGWSTFTGPPAALYNPGNQVCGDNGVTSWTQSGMSPQQMVLGLPFYGHVWTLQNANNNGFFAPTTGATTSSDGLSYNQIVRFKSQKGTTAGYNSTYVSNYCYSGTTWIGYDDTKSILTKVAYAKEKGLLGYYAWHVGGDNKWTLSRLASTAWNS